MSGETLAAGSELNAFIREKPAASASPLTDLEYGYSLSHSLLGIFVGNRQEVTSPNNLWRERTRDLVHYPKMQMWMKR
ncbi:hypothetical protein EC9_25130 [Rosistilla ulvae]|uniref:Uncharacterized protein n=1 Tax=Rosistilla ulvae TaxID=1930277 RepID=A0A517M0C6_9BACT|nr:hypothetical protein EC9_25130 [Rosistilla ulvae]